MCGNLEEKVSTENQPDIHLIYIGIPGFGTKAYDTSYMDGAKAFLKYNSGKKIDSLFLFGVIPYLPPFTSKQNSMDLRNLGNLPTKKGKSEEEFYELMTSVTEKQAESNKKYYDRFIEKKITNKAEAAEFAKLELSKLIDVLNKDITVHVQHTVAEHENIKYDEEIMISNIARQKEDLKSHEKEISELETLIEEKENFLKYLKPEKDVLNYIKNNLSKLKTDKKDDELKSYFKKQLDNIENNKKLKAHKAYVKLSKEDKEMIKEDIFSYKTKDDFIDKLYNYVRDEFDSVNKELKNLNSKKSEAELHIDSIATVWKSLGFSRVIKRAHLEADDSEIYYRIAKDKNNDVIYDASPDKWRNLEKNIDNFHVHSSGKKLVRLTGKKNQSDSVYIPGLKKDLQLLMWYKPNFLSNTPTFQDIQLQKNEAHRLNKIGREVPDIMLSAHGKGGFRVMPEQKYSENVIEGEESETPEIIMHFKLPTGQSEELLDYLESKNLKTLDTKRYTRQLYASGLVLHTIKGNGVHEVSYIDHTQLFEFAETEKEINKVRGILKRAKQKNAKKKWRRKLKDLTDSMKLNLKKIEVSGDTHIGSPNKPGRTSNYKLNDAAISYQSKNGIPNVIISSEISHGSLERPFASDKQDYSTLPYIFEKRIEEIEKNKNLSLDEKIKKIAEFSISDKQQRGLTTFSSQIEEIKYRIVPYLEKILENDGTVILVSGNHPNKTTKNIDEAQEIANVIPDSYKYINNKKLWIGKATGESYGTIAVRLPDNKTVFATHKPKNGQDVILGFMKQILGANLNTDFAVSFDRHHCGFGYADGTFYVASPGQQPYTEYVSNIGQTPGLRGLINIFYDPKKRFAKSEFVLNKPLKAYMK